MIVYKLKLHGIPITWKTVIDQWKEGESFTDWQEKGPYAVWHHVHSFQDYKGGTLMRDRIHYALPFRFLGESMAGLWVKRDVRAIFAYRTKVIQEILEKKK